MANFFYWGFLERLITRLNGRIQLLSNKVNHFGLLLLTRYNSTKESQQTMAPCDPALIRWDTRTRQHWTSSLELQILLASSVDTAIFVMAGTFHFSLWLVDGDRHFFNWISFTSNVRKMRGSLTESMKDKVIPLIT